MFNITIALTTCNEREWIAIEARGLVKDIDGYVTIYQESPSQWEYKIPIANVLYIRAVPAPK